MNPGELNIFERRLNRYLPLTADERQAIGRAEAGERHVAAGTRLVSEGDEIHSLFVVKRGWMHAAGSLPNGNRQITRFHYPGDLIGTSSIAWSRASETFTALEDCVLSDLPKKRLGELFVSQPRLGGVLYAVAAAEAVAASDRLTAMGRMDAEDRLSFLLLDMLARLRVTMAGVVDSFDLPLTQSDLADALGLTKVHVNRTLRALEEHEVIARTGRRIRLLDPRGLAERLGFSDRYAEVETGWLPAPPELAA